MRMAPPRTNLTLVALAVMASSDHAHGQRRRGRRPNATATVTPAQTASATATASVVPRTGDCDGNHVVSIDELIAGVGIVLGNQPPGTCPAMEDSAGQINIAQLIKAVRNALVGCGEAA